MKPDILLVMDADPKSARTVAAAVIKTRHLLVRATSSRQAFQILNDGLDQLDVVIVDVDSGVHGLQHCKSAAYTSDLWGHPHRSAAKCISYRGSARGERSAHFQLQELT
jgi:hypothetical protein